MNKIYGYLSTMMGNETCPIKGIHIAFNFGTNEPFKEILIIEYKDGTKEEFIEKPKKYEAPC